MSKVGVIGEGWVGKSMVELFPDAVVYDEPKIREQHTDDYSTAVRAGRTAINGCDIAFICVPTPNKENGELDTGIIEQVMVWCEVGTIVLRSTVNPGFTDKLSEFYKAQQFLMQPEYLGETVNHPMLNPKERPFMILGGEPEARRTLIDKYTEVYNANINIRQTTNLEAEVIKLSENRAIMHKVAEAQELYDVCESAGVDYYTVREAVYGDDPRFNLWFTFVYPEQRGANSKCIPKDVFAWAAWAESVGYEPEITNAILEKNKQWLA